MSTAMTLGSSVCAKGILQEIQARLPAATNAVPFLFVTEVGPDGDRCQTPRTARPRGFAPLRSGPVYDLQNKDAIEKRCAADCNGVDVGAINWRQIAGYADYLSTADVIAADEEAARRAIILIPALSRLQPWWRG